MRTLLSWMTPWMVLSASVSAQMRPAEVVVAHRSGAALSAHRLADECFLPVTALERIGWRYGMRGDNAVITAEGRETIVQTRVISGERCVPMTRVVDGLGGLGLWADGTDEFRVASILTRLSMDESGLIAGAPLTFVSEVQALSNPDRTVVDLRGVRLSEKTKIDLPERTSAVQWRLDVVRIVIEGGPHAGLPVRPVVGRELRLPSVRVVRPIEITNEPKVIDLAPVLELQGEEATLISIPLIVPLPEAPRLRTTEADAVEIVIPGVRGALAVRSMASAPGIRAITVRQDGESAVVRFQLTRPMAAELWVDNTKIQLQLLRPAAGTGTIAGKRIVIDPGYGAHDSGARGGGINEKDLALKISLLLAAELRKAGAEPILTRETDVFIPLSERAAIANSADADLFISVHINSAPRQVSGTITFYHGRREPSRTLAHNIHRELVKVSKLPNIGVWSDYRIYNTGFAVLRNTTMPGVLLELGFINHPTDRTRMQQSEFQSSAAQAIVRGIKEYYASER